MPAQPVLRWFAMDRGERREIEVRLLEKLRVHHQEWRAASREDRDAARKRFEETLKALDDLVLRGIPPEQ